MAHRGALLVPETESKLPPMVGAVIEVIERFHEEGESANTTDRSQLQNLLKYCRTHKGKVHFVVVHNLTRFAREKYDHFALHAHLKSLGISLRSATDPIDTRPQEN